VNALQDAVVLANCLYDMRSTSIEDITRALEEYREQRFEHVKTQYEASQWNAKVLYGHVSWSSGVLSLPFHYRQAHVAFVYYRWLTRSIPIPLIDNIGAYASTWHA